MKGRGDKMEGCSGGSLLLYSAFLKAGTKTLSRLETSFKVLCAFLANSHPGPRYQESFLR